MNWILDSTHSVRGVSSRGWMSLRIPNRNLWNGTFSPRNINHFVPPLRAWPLLPPRSPGSAPDSQPPVVGTWLSKVFLIKWSHHLLLRSLRRHHQRILRMFSTSLHRFLPSKTVALSRVLSEMDARVVNPHPRTTSKDIATHQPRIRNSLRFHWLDHNRTLDRVGRDPFWRIILLSSTATLRLSLPPFGLHSQRRLQKEVGNESQSNNHWLLLTNHPLLPPRTRCCNPCYEKRW